MFSIDWVKLENFRSYRGQHEFKLPEQPGLYLITGQNHQQPRLGSNDVGKSTLLDAVHWCYYGRTTRGLRASDVISWGEQHCAVTTQSTVAGEKLTITRTQGSNSLTLNGSPISQDALEKHLRLGPAAFTYSVLIPQFGESFFDLAPAAKLTLFSQIMELDLWLDKSRESEALAAEIIDLINVKKQAISRHEGQITTRVADIEHLGKRHREFDNEKARIIIELKRELSSLVGPDREAVKFAEAALANITVKLSGLEKTNKKCPTCGQKMHVGDLEALLRNRSDFEHQLNRCQHLETAHQTERHALNASIKKEGERPNPYLALIDTKKADIAKSKAALDRLRTEVERLEKDHLAVSYWVIGFKRIRLFIVEQTLRQLEIEVNNNMASLGLTNWRIEFDVERENKSGGVTKGFTVLVYSPDHDQPVRWEAWAGGVTQRLRLAGDLGMANLIMERAGLRSNVEFFDEPSRHLSQEGLLDVAETLNQRALAGSKRILLVDHATIDFGDFAGRFVIAKTSEGSRLTYS